MYAPQPPRPIKRPTSKKPALQQTNVVGRSRHRGRASHQDVVQEVGAKLAVNLVLMLVALVYLGRLLSYNTAQERKLERLRAEVTAVDSRVAKLQDEFAVQFDTHQTQQLVRQQRHRVSPNQMHVIWTAPSNTSASADGVQPPEGELDETAQPSQP